MSSKPRTRINPDARCDPSAGLVPLTVSVGWREGAFRITPTTCVAALAEVLWSPKADRDHDGFLKRFTVHVARLKELHVPYRPL